MPTLVKNREPTLRPLPASLELGPVHLTVSRLDRSVAWYQKALGLRVAGHEATRAALGDGTTTVLVLVEDALARPAGRHAGLYHYALLYPSREELARAAMRLASSRAPIDGASDHGTHEAIYLSDPDGNGIELAADRPRGLWPTPEEEFGRGGPLPLDLPNLLSTVEGEVLAPHVAAGLRIGHVHLHVGDVEQGLAFYCDLLGFEVWAQLDSAAFVSAGGYHHHLGFNVWRGRGVGAAPPHTVGLREWTIQLATPAEVAEVASRFGAAEEMTERDNVGLLVRDPWNIALRVVAGSSAAS
jgi:catechol 2,3-dioxygenase